MLALWKDKHFYPGHIASEEDGGKFCVNFEDDTTGICKDSEVIPCDLLSDGQEVFAKDDGDSYLAIVVRSDTREGSYVVRYSHNGKEKK